ncbi:MAG: hypothetical protein RTU30_04390, partial [Candidatus Thorarchaeota archaeon]
MSNTIDCICQYSTSTHAGLSDELVSAGIFHSGIPVTGRDAKSVPGGASYDVDRKKLGQHALSAKRPTTSVPFALILPTRRQRTLTIS